MMNIATEDRPVKVTVDLDGLLDGAEHCMVHHSP
jgi:hypothetical protein